MAVNENSAFLDSSAARAAASKIRQQREEAQSSVICRQIAHRDNLIDQCIHADRDRGGPAPQGLVSMRFHNVRRRKRAALHARIHGQDVHEHKLSEGCKFVLQESQSRFLIGWHWITSGPASRWRFRPADNVVASGEVN